MPFLYEGVELEVGYRTDLLVEDSIVLELQSVKSQVPIHKAQLLNYLELAKKEVGLLLNFNTAHLRAGIVRVANFFSPRVSCGSKNKLQIE